MQKPKTKQNVNVISNATKKPEESAKKKNNNTKNLGRKSQKLKKISNKNVNKDTELYNDWMSILKSECNNYPYSAFIINEESHIEYCNERVVNIFRYDVNELMGGDINSLLPPDYRSKHIDSIKNYFKFNNTDFVENTRVGFTKSDREIDIIYGIQLKKLIQSSTEQTTLCLLFVRQAEREYDWALILPENPLYIIWISFMFLFISMTMVLLPYDFVFNPINDSRVLNYSIYGLTILDIIFNFNCAYVLKEEVITDRNKIMKEYLTGYFVIDLQTGIPIEFFDGYIDTNILVILKLLRSLKLIKYYNALTNEYVIKLLSKNEMFKKFKSLVMNYQYYTQMFLLFCMFFVVNHYLTSAWVLVSYYQYNSLNWVHLSGIFNPVPLNIEMLFHSYRFYDYNEDKWIKFDPKLHQTVDPWEYIYTNPFNAYVSTYYEILNAFIGFRPLLTFNIYEIIFNYIIMFCGMFCIAYTIGNITMLILQLYQDDYLYYRMYQVVYSAASETELSDNTVDQVLRDLVKNHEWMSNLNLSTLRNRIPNSIFNLAQKEYYGDFLASHKLFKYLPLSSIEKLYRYCKLKTGGTLIEANQYATNVYLVVKGKVHAIDSYNNSVIEDFEENEIVGFNYIHNFVRKNMQIADSQIKQTLVTRLGQLTHQTLTLTSENESYKYEYTAVCENNFTQYYAISYIMIENIIKENKDFWYSFYKYHKIDSVFISDADLQNTDSELQAYETKHDSSMIFLPNYKLYSVNKEFIKIFNKEVHEFEGEDFFSVFELPSGPFPKPVPMKQLVSGKYLFNILDKKIEVELNFNHKSIIIEKKRIKMGKRNFIKAKSETTFVYISITNSIEAFLISKQRAVKNVVNLVNMELNMKNIDEEDDEISIEEDEYERQQKDLMVEDLQQRELEYQDFQEIMKMKMKEDKRKNPNKYNAPDKNGGKNNLNPNERNKTNVAVSSELVSVNASRNIKSNATLHSNKDSSIRSNRI